MPISSHHSPLTHHTHSHIHIHIHTHTHTHKLTHTHTHTHTTRNHTPTPTPILTFTPTCTLTGKLSASALWRRQHTFRCASSLTLLFPLSPSGRKRCDETP